MKLFRFDGCARPHARVHTRIHTHTHALVRTHARTHALTHAHAHSEIYSKVVFVYKGVLKCVDILNMTSLIFWQNQNRKFLFTLTLVITLRRLFSNVLHFLGIVKHLLVTPVNLMNKYESTMVYYKTNTAMTALAPPNEIAAGVKENIKDNSSTSIHHPSQQFSIYRSPLGEFWWKICIYKFNGLDWSLLVKHLEFEDVHNSWLYCFINPVELGTRV